MSSSIIHDQSTNALRTILGVAFDPMETSDIPSVYVTHTHSFHGSSASSSGGSINGKVSIVSGSNLDEIKDVVTGLPASDHDHGESVSFNRFALVLVNHPLTLVFFVCAAVNGIEFGDVSF